MFKSIDGGATWKERNIGWPNDGVFSLVFHPNDPEVLYAGTYNGVSRSRDGGGHWEPWATGFPGEQWTFAIAFDPIDPRIMYASTKNGENEGLGRDGFRGTVMKSTDDGESWSQIVNGLDLNQEFHAIVADPLAPGVVYLAAGMTGVHRSTDWGNTWSAWKEGLTSTYTGTNGNNVTHPLVITPDGSYLYFGSTGSGVFRRRIVR